MSFSIYRFPLLFILLFLGCTEDDEASTPSLPIVSIESLEVTEGDSERSVFVQLRMDKPVSNTARVYVQTEPETAEADSDFTSLDREVIVFEPGQQYKEIQVVVLGDEDFEPTETFLLVIDEVEGAQIGTSTATITLRNDDPNTNFDLPQTGYNTPETYPGMTLIWQDEFAASEINTSNWTFEIGTGNSGWGNNELQFYREDNASIREGNLIIEAREENFGGRSYTSTRMITQNKFDFQYGRVDIRAALPYGQGIWPALWMLGSSFSSVGWPACGEIDIMELVGHEPNTVHGTAHWSNAGSHAQFGGQTTLNSGSFQDEYHVFSIIWDDQQIQWLLDDNVYHVMNITAGELSEFHGDFFFIFNVAVGGNWPGSPDGSTVFPQRMIVDYIRVFQEQ